METEGVIGCLTAMMYRRVSSLELWRATETEAEGSQWIDHDLRSSVDYVIIHLKRIDELIYVMTP